MTEQPTPSDDDVEGHAYKRAFAEGDQAGDDVEGHAYKRAFAEGDETDDVSGHLSGALGAQRRDDGN
jgi:hypothetical protein